MSLGTILLIILVLLLVGALPAWPSSTVLHSAPKAQGIRQVGLRLGLNRLPGKAGKKEKSGGPRLTYTSSTRKLRPLILPERSRLSALFASSRLIAT